MRCKVIHALNLAAGLKREWYFFEISQADARVNFVSKKHIKTNKFGSLDVNRANVGFCGTKSKDRIIGSHKADKQTVLWTLGVLRQKSRRFVDLTLLFEMVKSLKSNVCKQI